MAGESKTDDDLQQTLEEMLHPTAEWCYFVAFVLKTALPRDEGIVPDILRIMREMLSSKLTELSLGDNQITDAGAMKLAEMLPSSKLTYLDLSSNDISDAGAMKLAEMVPSSKLALLDLGDNDISDAGKAALKNLKNKDGKYLTDY